MSNMSDRQFESHLWLSRMWGKDNEIESYEKRKADIISQLSGIGRYNADFIPANTGENGTETKNIEYSLLCEKIEKLINEISEENIRTLETIQKLPDAKMRSMLYDRYINRLSWNQIQSKYNYAERQPYRIIHKGLSLIRTYIPDAEVLQIIETGEILRG